MALKSSRQTALKVSRTTILWNILLAAFKFLTGVLAHSSAMLSDSVHSASDVFSTVIVMIGVKAAGKEADQCHPYGHERMECVAALLLSVMLFATGAGIGIAGIYKIFHSGSFPLPVPGLPALIAAIVSITVKEILYWYTRAAARQFGSGALMADAWHHRSDALSSVGSFAGILGARLGAPALDPLAGIVICAFIIKASFSVFIDSINKMVDKACDSQTAGAITDRILAQPGVLGIDRISTRMFADRIYVDVEIRTDGNATLIKAHEIAQRVHDSIEDGFPQVKHCMVHMNPSGGGQ